MDLTNIFGLAVHWSSDCNMACTYCYIKKDKSCMHDLNQKIRQSLQDGSYVNNIKKQLQDRKNQIEHISLWGAEPTINGKYFKDFIIELLDFFPNLSNLMFSTNALIGAKWINEHFINPIIEYADNNKRYINFTIQFSLDGPAWINDASRHPGATDNTVKTIKQLLLDIKESEYASFRFTIKPTLATNFMAIMNERGMESFEEYYTFFNDIHEDFLQSQRTSNVNVDTLGIPTLVDPGDHTPEDGKIFAKWINNLRHFDASQLEHYRNYPLIEQPIIGLNFLLDKDKGHLSAMPGFGSCSAGRNEITIDYLGNLYSCERIAKNLAYLPDEHPFILDNHSSIYTDENGWVKILYANEAFHYNGLARRLMAEPVILFAAQAGLIDKKYLYDVHARTILYYLSIGLMCHIGVEEDNTSNTFVYPLTYVCLLGNGAVDELLAYYFENEEKVWK